VGEKQFYDFLEIWRLYVRPPRTLQGVRGSAWKTFDNLGFVSYRERLCLRQTKLVDKTRFSGVVQVFLRSDTSGSLIALQCNFGAANNILIASGSRCSVSVATSIARQSGKLVSRLN